MPRSAEGFAPAHKPGIWEVDAPDGHRALAVYSTGGKRLLRIEIAAEVYSHAWIGWLERWLHRWDRGYIRIIR